MTHSSQLLGLFEPETGRGIQRFGSALSGRLPEFDQRQAQTQQKLSEERRRAFLLDNRQALRMIKSGNIEGAKQLFQNRIGAVRELGGDPSQSIELASMFNDGNIKEITEGLELIDARAVDAGIFKALPVEDTVAERRLALDRERFEADQAKVGKREIIKDVEGVSRFIDTGEVVLKGEDERALKVQRKKAETELAKVSKQTFKEAKDLRNEFDKNSDEFKKIRDAFKRIQVSSKDPSAAGDLALIFNYMKMLDPGSVVRESEFATAANSAGVPDRVRNTFNRILRGERLAVNQRADFVDRANSLFAGQREIQDATVTRFNLLADKFGIDRDAVTTDLSAGVSLRPDLPPINLGLDAGDGAKPISEMTLEELNAELAKVRGGGA